MLNVFKKMFFALVIFVVIFAIAGCVFRMEEPVPRNVRMWIGGGGPVTENVLLELNGNVLTAIVFDVGFLLNANFPSELTFDDTLLYDFVEKAPAIDEMFSIDSHRRGDWVRRVFNSGEVELSQQDLDSIWRLLHRVVNDDGDREFEWVTSIRGPIPYVWTIVDDEMYWSFYNNDVNSASRHRLQYINRDVLLLAYALIDLSPVPVGYYLQIGTPNTPLN